jgi:hypothetical protein
MKHRSALLRSTTYALRGGFLVRPLIIAIVLGAVGAVLSAVEEAMPGMGAFIPEVLFPSRQDPRVHRFYESCGFEPGVRTSYVANRPT